MPYKFPPPEWFEAGTPSATGLVVALWVITFGLPGSIVVFWIWKPRSRIVWGLATLFWGLTFLAAIASVTPIGISIFQQETFGLPIVMTLAVLVTLALPALVAGWQELFGNKARTQGFRDVRTWGCATICSWLLMHWLVLSFSLYHGREVENRRRCKSNLKAIGWAMHNFHDTYNQFPDTRISDGDGPPRSWRIDIRDYVDAHPIGNDYDRTQAWDSPANLGLSRQQFPLYRCPAVPEKFAHDANGSWYTAYAALIGEQTVFPGGRGRATKELTDGASMTVLVVEACGQQIIWTQPRDIEISDQTMGINLPGSRPGQSPANWSSYHHKGAFVLTADGAVRYLNADTDPRVLRAITTANGGEKDLSDW